MAENVQRPIEVPVGLSIFGSLITEMSPSDLPEGVSPDNQDVVYIPGGVTSRPCLSKIYPQLGGNVTVTYIKTYIQPNGVPLNIILDSTGNLWKEDVNNFPGVLVKFANVAPGSYCTSVTAFGREYMSFHDGKVGTDAPFQFDGTNFDRVTQDGPAAGPTLTNFLPPPATLLGGAPAAPVNITSATTTDQFTITIPGTRIPHQPYVPPETVVYYKTLTVVTAAPHGLIAGELVTLAGINPVDLNIGPIPVLQIVNNVTFKLRFLTQTFEVGVGGTSTGQSPVVNRYQNVVTVNTQAAHGFQPGWQVVIAGVLNNNIGGGITALVRLSGTTTVTTATAHNLPIGANIQIIGAADATFNGLFVVVGVLSATKFTYAQPLVADLTVGAAGNVQDVWTGTFVISSVPSSTSFTYSNPGPDDQSYSGSGTATATILGRVTVGAHQCVLMFQTRQGAITAPCPPINFQANGNQLVLIDNLPIGPPNVVARILAFTGSGGANYFYIPIPAVIAGQAQSTATLINDNTTTSILLDFSDNTLFASLAIDIPGNNLFAQTVLSPNIGFFAYADRLFSWGEFNKIGNMVNMGFDGGYLPNAPTFPSGWLHDYSPSGGVNYTSIGGTLINDPRFGQAWQVTGDGINLIQGQLLQSASQDAYGVPILLPNTQYSIKIRVSSTGGGGQLVFAFNSPTQGQTGNAVIQLNPAFTTKWITVPFTALTPTVIPGDINFVMSFNNLANGQVVTTDEIEIIYTAKSVYPNMRVSYVINPEGFDSITGNLGVIEDPTTFQTCFEYHDVLHLLTGRGLYSTRDIGTSEPSGWSVNEISSRCGAASPRACDIGENFATWISSPISDPPAGRGLYVYTGGTVYKVSQEIQTIFDSINLAAQQSIWVKNDPITRRIYMGVPINGLTPTQVLVLDYRELDTALDIASRPPVHISFTGKMICSDLSRKWTRWNIQANCAGTLMQSSESVEFCFGAGNGFILNSGTGFGNVYKLNPNKFTDDDYGQMTPYYTTYFFINHEMESILQVGLHRKRYKRFSAYVSGRGLLSVTPYSDNLANPYPSPPQVPLNATQLYDIGDGLNVDAERCAFKVASVPLPGQTDNSFNLQKFVATLMEEPVSPIRFGAV